MSGMDEDDHEESERKDGPKKPRRELLVPHQGFVPASQLPATSGAVAAPPGLSQGSVAGGLQTPLALANVGAIQTADQGPNAEAHREFRAIVDKTFGAKLSAEDMAYLKKCTAELGTKIGSLQEVNKRTETS